MVSKSFEGQTDKTEEWYGTQYKQEAISDATVKVQLWCPGEAGADARTLTGVSLLFVSEMGRRGPQWQVQVTHEE